MVTGEKKFEYRNPSKWIKSRLWKLKGKICDAQVPVYEKKEYDLVEFTNGYGSDKPRFTVEYLGFMENVVQHENEYSNGLIVEVKERDIIIQLGEIKSINNRK